MFGQFQDMNFINEKLICLVKLKYGRGPLSASAEDAGLNDKREGTGRYA